MPSSFDDDWDSIPQSPHAAPTSPVNAPEHSPPEPDSTTQFAAVNGPAWLPAIALALSAVAIVGGFLFRTAPVALIFLWLVGGPIALTVVAFGYVHDTKRRTNPFYNELGLFRPLSWLAVAACLGSIGITAYFFADLAARGAVL